MTPHNVQEGLRSLAAQPLGAAGFPFGANLQNLSLGMHRIYAPRIVADHIMMQDDFVRLHRFLLETEDIAEISDDLRNVVEEEWPELTHKLPPKKPDA